MKALSGALAALALVIAGLVTGAAPAAAAPYPHTVPTTCTVQPKPGKIRIGQRPAVSFKLQAGTVKPRTKVAVKAIKLSPRAKRWTAVRIYHGHRAIWLLKRLPAGKYRIKYRATFKANSVFMDCRVSHKLKVVR
jgi:hypothetical protein